MRLELDRIVRQRNTLLKQAGGKLSDEIEATLDVWDAKMIDLGGRLIAERRRVLELLEPALEASYRTLASAAPEVRATYVASTGDQDLATALAEARRDDLRRGVSTVGPHRDDLAVTIDDRDTRTRASQGEQRSLALAAKLASHHVATEHTGTAPILLLDDVFSELDVQRSRALVTHLPAAQTLLSTAAGVPGEVAPQQVLRVDAGRLVTGSA